MNYVPRSPRRSTKLRAVLDDGSFGLVRDMSTSGLFVEGTSALAVGRKVAVVPLVGELDGQRLPAEVARVGERGIALRFLGLDPEHRQRLRSIFGDEKLIVTRSSVPLPVIPDDAPVVLLTDEPAAVALIESIANADDGQEMRLQIEELESQLLEMIRDKSALLDENSLLKRKVVALTARNSLLNRVQDELLEAHELLLEVERARDALLHEVQRLERIVSG